MIVIVICGVVNIHPARIVQLHIVVVVVVAAVLVSACHRHGGK